MSRTQKKKAELVDVVILCEWKRRKPTDHLDWWRDSIKEICTRIRASRGLSGNVARVRKVQIPTFGIVHDALVRSLCDADIVIADCTSFKKPGKLNLNVIYEMGMAFLVFALQRNKDAMSALQKRRFPCQLFVFVAANSKSDYHRLLSDRAGNLRFTYSGDNLPREAQDKVKKSIYDAFRKKNAKR